MEKHHLLAGIGGWLLLPAIGIIISPILILVGVYTSFVPLFTDGTWQALTQPDSYAYHPMWGPLIAFEVLGNVALVALVIWLGWLFFRYDERTPRMYILYLLVTPAFLIADLILAGQMPGMEEPDPIVVRDTGRSLVQAAIWIPYFLKSERVKNTFTKYAGSDSPPVPE